MRPWAVWLINHNLRFVLLAILVVLSPIYFLNRVPTALAEGLGDFTDEWKAIQREAK